MVRNYFIVLLFSTMMASASFSTSLFDSQIERMKSAGFQTENFSHRSDAIVVRAPILKMSFPAVGGVKSGECQATFKANEVANYLSKEIKISYSEKGADVEITFLMARDYTLLFYFTTNKGDKVSIIYYVKFEGESALESFPPILKDNFPVYPTGYFYRNGLLMRNFDQRYFFNTAKKTWTIRYKGKALTSNNYWVVERPGVIYNPKNIKTSNSDDGSVITFDFPETGVYHVILKNQSNGLIARWKVRCVEANQSAYPSQKKGLDQSRSLELTLAVQDMPFEWEMDLDTLAKNLKQGSSSPSELHEMVYAWVTQNFTYDYYFLEAWSKMAYPGYSENFDVNKPYVRVAICGGYALLCDLLSSKMGLASYQLVGSVISNNTKDENISWAGHAWNAVKLDGKWYYYDATWGITKTDPANFQFTRTVDSLFRRWWVFLPSEFTEKEGLTYNLDRKGVERLPLILPYRLAESGISLSDLPFATYRVDQNKSFWVRLNAKKGFDISARYFKFGSKDIKYTGSFAYENGQYKQEINIPENGDYRLFINILDENKYGVGEIIYRVTVSDNPKLSATKKKDTYKFAGNYKLLSPSGETASLVVAQTGQKFSADFAYKKTSMTGTITEDLVFGTWRDEDGHTGWFSFRANEIDENLDGSWGITSGHTFGPLYATKSN